jgi:hypothetical protein
MWRSCAGHSQPRAVAPARTILVRTNDNSNDSPKIPKYKTVNQAPHGQPTEAKTMLSSALGNLRGHTLPSTIQDEPFCKWRSPNIPKLSEGWQSPFSIHLWKFKYTIQNITVRVLKDGVERLLTGRHESRHFLTAPYGVLPVACRTCE